jgi:hypothetical protein
VANISAFYYWFYKFRSNDFKIERKFFLNAAGIECLSALMGLIFYIGLSIKINLIWTSFILLPITAGSYLFFMGIWVSNDYFIYELPPGSKELFR